MNELLVLDASDIEEPDCPAIQFSELPNLLYGVRQ